MHNSDPIMAICHNINCCAETQSALAYSSNYNICAAFVNHSDKIYGTHLRTMATTAPFSTRTVVLPADQ